MGEACFIEVDETVYDHMFYVMTLKHITGEALDQADFVSADRTHSQI
jgi:hypothetical protein